MTRLRLRDRFFRPSVARAITSPAGLVVGSTAAAILLAGGAPVSGAVAAGALAWVVPVLRSVFRGQTPILDPGRWADDALPEHWAAPVDDAREALRRYRRVMARCEAGPLRDRLEELEAEFDASVTRCRDLAQWGADAEAARNELDPPGIERRARASAKQAKKAAAAQREVRGRLASVSDQAMARLALINGRLDEAVGRAVEMAARLDCDDEGDLDREAGEMAAELRLLQAALEEVEALRLDPAQRLAPGRGTGATG